MRQDNINICRNIQSIPGVYRITNIVNNKIYIGSSINCKIRIIDHFSHLRKNKHHNIHLQLSYNKYGESSFEVDLLCCVFKNQDLIDVEQYFLDLYESYDDKNGYNICKKAYSSLGTKRSLEDRKKQSENQKGEKNPFYGKTHSEESKKLIGEQSRLRLIKNGSPFLGKSHSDDVKKILSEKAKKRNELGIKPFLGKHHTEESKNKLREYRKIEPFKCDQTNQIFTSCSESDRTLNLPRKSTESVIYGKCNRTHQYTFSRLNGVKIDASNPLIMRKKNKNKNLQKISRHKTSISNETRKKLRENFRMKPFRCDQTQQIFNFLSEAEDVLNIPRGYLGSVTRGKYDQTQGFTFSRLDGTKIGRDSPL